MIVNNTHKHIHEDRTAVPLLLLKQFVGIVSLPIHIKRRVPVTQVLLYLVQYRPAKKKVPIKKEGNAHFLENAKKIGSRKPPSGNPCTKSYQGM